MRKIATILFSLFIISGASAQSLVDTPVTITSASMNMAGKVDSITEFVMIPKIIADGANAKTVKGTEGQNIIIPDTSLQLIEEKAWKFDEDGNLQTEIYSLWDDKKASLYEVAATKYGYKKERINFCINRKDESVLDSVAYVYSLGRISSCEQYDARGKYKGRKQFFINREKMLSTISNKDAKLELIDMTKLKYNEEREFVEATFHDKDQKLVMTKKYDVSLDSAGRKHVKIFEYAKPDTCTGMESYLLDDAGNKVEEVTQDAQGNVLKYTSATFNENGHMVKKAAFMKEMEITCTYEYDENRNWTMKRIYHDGQPYRFIRRTINYYE